MAIPITIGIAWGCALYIALVGSEGGKVLASMSWWGDLNAGEVANLISTSVAFISLGP